MKFNKENIIKVLDTIYDNALEGLPKTETVFEFAESYLDSNNGDIEKAIDSLIKWQTTKNATNGFVSNLGGAITLPISIPVELTASIYIQIRMIAAIAHLSGLDPRDDKVKTLIYASLIGDACKDVLKRAGVEFGTKITKVIISNITRETLVQINQQAGFRLITKFGEKGVINMGKWIPFVGGAIGGSMEAYFCYKSGNTAKSLFYNSNHKEAA